MSKIYEGKHLRITKARGFRLGVAYIPHYRSNPDVSVNRARSLMAWCGPYIVAWDYHKRGYEPRLPWDPDRLASLDEGRANLTLEIARAMRAKRRWDKHLMMGRVYGMGEQKLNESLHDDVRRRWQAESDAVKLQEMERAERDNQG